VTKIKKIIFLLFIFLTFVEKINSEISDSLYMTVGDIAVTQSDIVKEIKIILILTNQSYSNERSEQFQEAAVKAIIKRNIKRLELEKNEYYNFDREDLKKELNKLANNMGLDLETLKSVFDTNEIDFSNIEEQVKVELYWNSLIFQMYKDRISVNPDEIDDKLKLIRSEKIEEYLIAEILLPRTDNEIVEDQVKEIKNIIDIEGFENAAKKFSISKTSLEGGNMGWLSEKILSEKIRNVVFSTAVGSLSEPLVIPEGILIFKVKDKRNVESNLSLEAAKEQLIQIEKSKILQMYSMSHYDKLRRSTSITFLNE
jgi:peptidyl-prolyl cis-trans isomerase SurA